MQLNCLKLQNKIVLLPRHPEAQTFFVYNKINNHDHFAVAAEMTHGYLDYIPLSHHNGYSGDSTSCSYASA